MGEVVGGFIWGFPMKKGTLLVQTYLFFSLSLPLEPCVYLSSEFLRDLDL
jgi:hypothetical protein